MIKRTPLLSLATVLVLVVAACTSGADDTTTTTVTTSTTTLPPATTTTAPPDGFGGEATVELPFGIATLNPFQAGGVAEARFVGNALWATVYDIDPVTWERIPDNVSELPSKADGAIVVNDDGSMTVQYQVPRTATWSDGRPVTGADLAFTAEVMRDLAFTGNAAVDPIMKSVLSTDSVEQVAWITFSEPNLVFEDALWLILPSHFLEGVDLASGSDGSDWPSGGPFMVEEFEPRGTISLIRNPNYWKTDDSGKQLPYLDGLVFSPSDGDDGEAFVSEAVDVALISAVPGTLEAIEQEAANGAELLKVASPLFEHLTFNFLEQRDSVNPASMNDDVTFRQAVPRSLDPTMFDRPETAWTGSWPGVLTATDGSAWLPYAHDVAAAQDAIAALENPLPVANLTTTDNANVRVEIGTAMKSSLGAVGVDLSTEFIDSLEFFGDVLGAGTYDLGIWAWRNDGGYRNVVDLMEALAPVPETGGFNGWGAGDSASEVTERYLELVSAARSTADPAEFETIVAEAEAILASELPLVPLVHRAAYAAVWADRILNVRHNATSAGLTWNVEAWQRVGE